MQIYTNFAPVKSINQIISPIAAELQQFEAFFGQTMCAETEPMDSIMRYVWDSRGKRLRPILVLLSAKLFGVINEQTLRAATFVEMIHSATLIHDDVVDDDDQRRGHASVKAQFGNLSAVLAGDYLLAKAMLLIANDTDILNEMLRTTAAMSEGELMQLSGLNDYLEIITRKTALLMRSCCVIGAMSVGAAEEQIQRIADFGLHFGILFQLRDDILDTENVDKANDLITNYLERTINRIHNKPAFARYSENDEVQTVLYNSPVLFVGTNACGPAK